MSWVAVAVGGGAALGGTASYLGTKNKIKRDDYGLLNPEQRQVNKALGGYITGDLSKDFSYGGQLTEGIGTGEQDVVNQNARINAIAGDTYGRLADYNDPAFNQQFEEEISRPTLQNFQNNIAPYLAQELPSFGTARATVIARELGNLQNNVMTQRFAAREAAKDRALRAASDSAGYFQTAAGIQSIPRQIKQAGLDREYQNFIQANAQKADSLNRALEFLGLTTGYSYEKKNTAGQVLQGAMSGAMMGANIAGAGGFGGGGGGAAPSMNAAYGNSVTPYRAPTASQINSVNSFSAY